jgi:N-acetylmuramic acid 6-phosphate etherase
VNGDFPIGLSDLITESVNDESKDLDLKSISEILVLINEQDRLVPKAVEKCIPDIEHAVVASLKRVKDGGRVIYVGSGTSGRIAELDASEIPPTYGFQSENFFAIQSGPTMRNLEIPEQNDSGASEDLIELAPKVLANCGLRNIDIVFGVAASGRTPFVLSALEYSRGVGALTILLTNNRISPIHQHSDISITCEVGPEVIMGSTRMKSGTSQKLILNMFSTALMVKLGKSYGNLMTHMKIGNIKLNDRAIRIVAQATSESTRVCADALIDTRNDIPLAIVYLKSGRQIEECKYVLSKNNNQIRGALEALEVE